MYRPFDLTGKVALVTGGNSGIGLGMARAVAQAGADVAIWGTNPAKNAAAKSELATTGREIVTLECDVSDEQAVETAFGETLRLRGRGGVLSGVLPRPRPAPRVKSDKVYLVGFMGAGKSTVARVLARRLHWKAEDIDEWIEREERRDIVLRDERGRVAPRHEGQSRRRLFHLSRSGQAHDRARRWRRPGWNGIASCH